MRARDVSRRVAAASAAAVAACVAAAAAAALFAAPGRARDVAAAAHDADPCPACATIRLDPAPADGAAEVDVRVGAAATDVRLRVVGGRAEFDVPDGRTARAYVACGRDVVWPRSAPISDGRTTVFHVEPLFAIPLVGPPDATGPVPRVRFVPDRTVVPPGPAGRLDAVQAWIDTEMVTIVRRGGDSAALVPRGTAWWVLAETGAGPCAAHVVAGERATDVPTAREPVAVAPATCGVVLRANPRRAIVRAPTVRGRPVPADTLVAPGRLDVAAAAAFRAAVADRAFSGALVVEPGAWAPASLPSADVLTLAHPSFGVAYAEWPADGGPADARPEPGAIDFAAPGAADVSIAVAVWPAWPGTGAVFSRPSDRLLRLVAPGGAGAGPLRTVRGLPPGAYRFDYAAVRGALSPGARLRRGEVRVEAAGPPPRVEVIVTGD